MCKCMTTYNPQLVNIKSLEDAKKEMNKIGCDPKGIEIMAPKAILKVIKLEKVLLQDAFIIKQDMLSIGGEVATSWETITLKEKYGDILIMGTIAQLRELVEKLNRHYSRIQAIAKELSKIISVF